jgi:phosphoribosylanthranilate isomerase
MEKRPYIGISGIENRHQLGSLLNIYEGRGKIPHMLALGCIVSYKTLAGIKENPRVLTKNEILEIYKGLKHYDTDVLENVLFSLHYYTIEPEKAKPMVNKVSALVKKQLSYQITRLFEDIYNDYDRTTPGFRLGVQLNISWPEPREVELIKKYHPRLMTILQVSDFDSIEEKIGKYDVDYILFDESRGMAKDVDAEKMISIYKAIKGKTSAVLGFAGGYSAENVRPRVNEMRNKTGTKNISIDAEGKMRTPFNYFNQMLADGFLKSSIEAFAE